MAKKTIFFFILFFTVILTFGQEPFQKKVMIGIKGGWTTSQVRFYPNVDQNLNNGFTGGILLKFISERHVGIQTELNYCQKGWEEQFTDTTYSRRLNYLDIPFMTHVSIGKKRFGVFFNIGPSISFLLSEKESVKPAGASIEDIVEEDKYYGQPIDNKIDFQFTAGIGVRMELERGNTIELEGRVYGSLPNILDTKKYIYSASQNQLATVTLSYLFLVNKKNHNKIKKVMK